MKADFRENIYALGIPIRVREMEAELRAYQKDHPELFLSETPIMILRPEHRVNGHGGERYAERNTNGTGKTSGAVRATRERTAAWLEKVAATPRRTVHLDTLRDWGVDARGVMSLVNAGLLTRKGDTITRTRKVFYTNPYDRKRVKENTAAAPTSKAKRPKHYSPAQLKKRQASAALIAGFDLKTPQPPPPEYKRAMGALVRRGYLRGVGRGLYVRTAKQYVITRP